MSDEPSAENPSCVLVVDNEEGPRDALRFILDRQFRVLTATGGEEALSILRREAVDVVTLDLAMPGVDGLETLTRMREIVPDVEVVIVTGYGSYDSAREAIRLRAFDFIDKPFQSSKVLDVIQRAAESARAKRMFLANIGHELRTPLTVIVGYSSLVADYANQKGNARDLPVVGVIERATDRLVNTVHSVVDLSMIEAGSFTLQPERVDLDALLEKEVRHLEREAQRKGLTLSLDVREPGLAVRFDPYCLSHALRKLLDNAIKFTERGGVAVRLERDHGGRLSLAVHDTGIGIGKAHLPRLFRKFCQEDPGANRKFEGLGIGLALTKKLVERNGASLSVESEKDKGSVFRIHFAATSEIREAATSPAAAEPDPGAESATR
ncbi:MAG: response regulator [Deltaproteobacteria bacterium]|nr:response regulator [Deltaproteobacteria bacterium]